ncbi:MAG: FecR family protein [Planctomycetota bacterium]|nr:FecR family protein [Planctomycetota bacterium]
MNPDQMTPERRDQLLVRYLDGNLSQAEVDALSALLKTDADARAALREMTMQALAMADLAREQMIKAPLRAQPVRETGGPRRWKRAAVAVAAAAAVIVGAAAFWLSRERAEIITLTQVSGAASWSPEGGQAESGLEPGARMRAGTLSVEGAASSAQLRFGDGSVVTVAGDSELALSHGAQKQLALRHGSLTGDIRPQPAGRPMTVRTPTAEVEVLGTRFLLVAQSGETQLSVESGLVRLRRLADDSTIEVPQGHVAVATLETAERLGSRQLPPAPSEWRQTFDQPPPATWQGEWRPADASGPGRLRNVLDMSYRRDDGTPVAAYIVCVHDKSGSVASVWPNSVLRLRLRTATKQDVVALVSLHNAVGGFAGNFQTTLKPDAGRADAAGWRTLDLPLASLEGKFPAGVRLQPGSRVFLVYLACYSPKAELEVAEVAIMHPSSGASR